MSIHNDFFEAKKRIYDQMGWVLENAQSEAESQEYGACTFNMNNCAVIFRVAKITPTKSGQFVTLWKRIGNGPIMPYDITDPIDLVVVTVHNKDHFGQFVFPKKVLCEKGIISHSGKEGKRAFRVYPSWDIADNAQAKKTQTWQLQYFFKVDSTDHLDKHIVEKLYHILNFK